MLNNDEGKEDLGTRGFLDKKPDALRYAASTRMRWEATGMICDRISSGARVLDIGCGTGSISSLVVSECHVDLVGVEPDSRRAAACRERGLLVECGYYDEAMAEALGAFDVIMFADVLEHLADPSSLLELASRHLKADGVILASIPNIAHWTVRLQLLFGRFDYVPSGIMDATHLRWFTTRTIKRVFSSVGLEVVDHDWTSGAWMSQYHRVPLWLRTPILRRLVRLIPGFFACQHIVTAKVRGATG